jgi:hypothetical protein
VDWLYIVLVAVLLGVLLALWIGGMRVYLNGGFNIDFRRPRKPSRIRHAKGEFHPPEPPEG